jgi:uncharacterized surface protein with fasciclin (FAS1) repeats
MKKFKIAAIAGVATLALAACSDPQAGQPTDETVAADEANMSSTDVVAAEEASTDKAMPTADKNIVEMAQGTPATSTLVTAVTAAGLGETLAGTGPFTVFAPTNDAFAKIDKAKLDGLLKAESKDALGGILKYHVVPGNVMAADVAKMITQGGGKATIKTLNGSLTASMNGKDVILTDAKGGKAKITGTDMKASNGVIHTIDTVVMP